MSQLSIVTNSLNAPGATRLFQVAKAAGIDASIVELNSDIVASTIDSSKKAIYRIGPKSYAGYQELKFKLSVDKQASLEKSLVAFDKILSWQIMHENGIAVPDSEPVSNIQKLEGHGKYPYVLKIAVGNQGKGVYLIKSKKDLTEALYQHPRSTHFLKQEFIANSKGSDKRLFVVGGKVVAAMQRVAQANEFRANLHTGGSATGYTPTNFEIDLAVKSTELHGLIFAGVDIIDSHKGPLVLEINPSPGLKIEEITSTDIAPLIINAVMGKTNDTNT